MTARSASGSSRSPSAVEPATSQKRTVTTLRCSRAGATSRRAPHVSQKRASSRFAAPQLAQITTTTLLRDDAAEGVVRGVAVRLERRAWDRRTEHRPDVHVAESRALLLGQPPPQRCLLREPELLRHPLGD